MLSLIELSDGSMRCASKDFNAVTLTKYSVIVSTFSIGGFQDTFSCFSVNGSTSTSSGGLGRSSVEECKDVIEVKTFLTPNVTV